MTLRISKTILITGASSGIGAATARAFANAGAQVAITARRTDRLTALAAEIGAFPIAADLTQTGECARVVAETLTHFGSLEVLVNNAGAGRLNWLEQLSAEEVTTQVQLNLTSVIELTRLVLPTMLERRRGHIINMASIGGLIGAPTYSVYSATKFGVRGFSEAVRREVEPFGVRVSVISPGGVSATEFAEQAGIQRTTTMTTPTWIQPTAAEVARAVVGLVRWPRREIIIPAPLGFLVWINQLFPTLTDWVVELGFTRRERR